jgi:hypothetical protein
MLFAKKCYNNYKHITLTPIMRFKTSAIFLFSSAILLFASPVMSQTENNSDLDINPDVIKSSPVLQKWRKQVPSVWDDINHTPSFKTRFRLGYNQFPSNGDASGFNVGVEDVFIPKTKLTVSAEYQGSFNGDRSYFGTDLRYYVRDLGTYVNVAPTVGYRHIETPKYQRDGVNLGVKVQLNLSRGGGADLALTQSWVSPGSNKEIGLTGLSVGYAVTKKTRLAIDIQKQNAPENKDSRVGFVWEWMP